MNKPQVILTVVAILLVVGLYSLPKVVIDGGTPEEATFIDDSVPGGVMDHSTEIPEEFLPRINSWKSQLIVNDQIQLKPESLDSLMAVFIEINKYDSAAYYAELFAERFNEIDHWQKAGDAYYNAFTYALDKSKINMLVQKTRRAYDKVLAQEPNNLDVKHNVAMTYLASTSPMQGIMMLREILDIDPKNLKTLFSMGIMSIDTNQYANAIERFETLVEHYPDHVEGNFFLGISYYETGQMVKARTQFNKVKELGANEQTITAADEYLERIS
ncbi:tetratricopeptide repeat protein [Roseivirga sp.]|uniref:tetratricopeptide repeat protein n=1 Tax=Roseivirga sp. TaxID=1964215 RepID=UPI003B8D74B0